MLDLEPKRPTDWDDTELMKAVPEAAGPPPGGGVRPWFLAAGLLAAAALLIYVAFGNWTFGRRSTTDVAPAAPAAPAAATRPLGGEPLAVVVPPLDESDAIVAQLLKELSMHPRVVSWLATKGLIRNFTAVVANIAEGGAPTALLPALQPSARFGVIERGAVLYVDPKSYERYTGIAEAVASLDPAASARVYATLKPRIQEAYGDLGLREPLFDRTLQRAIVQLLATPVPDDPIPIVVAPQGIGYAFKDARLERLTAAQKQLLRTGPQNARALQRSLRQIAQALGMPLEN